MSIFGIVIFVCNQESEIPTYNYFFKHPVYENNSFPFFICQYICTYFQFKFN
jgi:hypothetical protein